MTIKIYNTAELKIFSDRMGGIYGTEDWCMFMYSIVKMHKPKTIIELGTGCAVTSMWMAQAVKENEVGHILTIDDGRDWQDVLQGNQPMFLPDEKKESFQEYFNLLTEKFELKDQITLEMTAMPPFPQVDGTLDLLFSDFMHDPNSLIEILSFYLPKMSAASSIFMDSASTSFPSYCFLELLTQHLNQGKIPLMLLNKVSDGDKKRVHELVSNSKFTLIHICEAKDREQNSTAWLKIEPCDIRPYPKTRFH